MAKKALPKVRTTPFVVISKQDALVPLSVREFIDSKIKAEYLVLEKSPHLIFKDVEKEVVVSKVIDFLN